MTRYSGKLLKADKISTVIDNVLEPQNTIRYKTYRLVKNSKKPVILNDIHRQISPDSTRRVFERVLSDLANAGYITRNKCQCGCSYIYSP